MSNTANEACQMLQRVRHFTDKEIRLFVSGSTEEKYSVTIEELKKQVLEKYELVRLTSSKVDGLLYSGGKQAFLNAVYSHITMNNILEKRMSIENMLFEMKANISKYLLDPVLQIHRIPAQIVDTHMKEINRAVKNLDIRRVCQTQVNF